MRKSSRGGQVRKTPRPGVGKRRSQISSEGPSGLESEGEYDACLSHPRVGSRGLGRGTSGSDVTTAELTLRLATGLFR